MKLQELQRNMDLSIILMGAIIIFSTILLTIYNETIYSKEYNATKPDIDIISPKEIYEEFIKDIILNKSGEDTNITFDTSDPMDIIDIDTDIPMEDLNISNITHDEVGLDIQKETQTINLPQGEESIEANDVKTTIPGPDIVWTKDNDNFYVIDKNDTILPESYVSTVKEELDKFKEKDYRLSQYSLLSKLDTLEVKNTKETPIYLASAREPSTNMFVRKQAGDNKHNSFVLGKVDTSAEVVYETLYDVTYNNRKRTVTYHRKDYILRETDGIIHYEVKTYNITALSNATIAERKNNPGNLTCSNGLRPKAYAILKRNASDPGDAKSCIYASVELGMQDYMDLLQSNMYNDSPIYESFKKYQSDQVSFQSKLKALRRAGIDTNKRFNDLSKLEQLKFASIYAKYEGFRGLDDSKIIVSKPTIDEGVLYNDPEELNSYLVYNNKQVVLKRQIRG